MNHSAPRRRTKFIAGASAAVASLTTGLVFASPAGAKPLGPAPGPRTTTSFVNNQHVLTIVGDSGDNSISVGRDAAGVITINGVDLVLNGVTVTVANVNKIVLEGGSGSDRLGIDDSNGPMPVASILGQSGDDELFSGSGNDTLVGGAGNDQIFGEAGNDQFIWNPGDGSDFDEGGDGTDAIIVNGGDGSENFTATANGSRVQFDRLSPAPFSLDIGSAEQLVLRAHGGNDSFTASGDLASLIALTVDGGSGNDRITGGNGNDTLIGGAGNDVIDGKQGDDKVFLGAGDDSFQWDPGDGSDTVEGRAGHDSLLFNGASGPENIDLSTNGTRVRLVRDIGKVTMDLNGLEALRVNALAGDDIVDAHALTSGLTSLTLDGGDGNDQLIGSAGNDVLLGGNGDDKLVGGPGQDVLDGGTGSNVLIQ